MIIARIEGANRVCGKSQGYMGLPVRDEPSEINGVPCTIMHTAWEPTPEEIELIKNGAKIIVSMISFADPPLPTPMIVNVGK